MTRAARPPFSGRHLLADLYGCRGLDDPAHVERALREAVATARATLLDVRVHHFGERRGVTGVALLAESHISIHTWPEYDYAAVDIFLCGAAADVRSALGSLADHLAATEIDERTIRRGFSCLAGPTLS